MITTLFIITSFMLICLQSTLWAYYLIAFLTCKISKWQFLLVSFFAVLLTRISISNHKGISVDLRLLTFIVLLILIILFFTGSIYKKIFHFLFLCCLFLIQNEFLQSLTNSRITGKWQFYFILIYILVTAAAFIFVAILRRLGIKNTVILNPTEYLILSIFPFTSIIALVNSWYLEANAQGIIAIIIFIFNTAVFYLYTYIGKKNLVIQQQEVMTMQNNFHSEFLNQQRELQLVRHDLKNMLLEIEALAKKQDFSGIEQTVQEILGTKSLVSKKYSGCFVIDSVLSNKVGLMETSGIAHTLNLLIPSDLKFQGKELDICAILGNLLDNAIEEMKRNQSQTAIDVNIYYKNENLVFRIDNATFNGSIDLTGGSVSSSKKKGRIGLGIASIRERVFHLQGYSSFTVKKNVFRALVVIPLEPID